jgi:multidrug transporter EmrE-like cation transporter
MGSLIIKRPAFSFESVHEKWFPYAIFLSLMFIIFFNVGAFAIQKVGLIIISIFQKLSLIFPVIIGILLFGETSHILKITAIIIALFAIVLLNLPDKLKTSDELIKQYWYLPFLVLLGNGIIEVTLFYVEENSILGQASLSFVSTLFLLSGIWGLFYMLLIQRTGFSKTDIIGGISLGIPNFFTIYLLVRALETGWDGSVLFPVNNVGTLAFTALVGLFVFKEKLSRYNYWGLFLAILAVILISR